MMTNCRHGCARALLFIAFRAKITPLEH